MTGQLAFGHSMQLRLKCGEKRGGSSALTVLGGVNQIGDCRIHAVPPTDVKDPGTCKPVLFWRASQDNPYGRNGQAQT